MPRAIDELRSLGHGMAEIPSATATHEIAPPGSPSPKDRLTTAELARLTRLAGAIHERVSQRERDGGGEQRLSRVWMVTEADALHILSVQGPIEPDGSLEFEGVELIRQEPGPQGKRYVFGIFADGQIIPTVTLQQGPIATAELLSSPRMQALLEQELSFWWRL